MKQDLHQDKMTARWSAMDDAMASHDYDVAIIYGKGIITQYGYLNYFGGYFPVLRPGFVVYPRGGKPTALYNTRADAYLARQTGTIADVRFAGTGDVLHSEEALLGEVAALVDSYQPARVGVVGLKSLMTGYQQAYLSARIDAAVEDASAMANRIKAYKTDEEQAGIAAAFELAEQSFLTFREHLRAGATPAEIAAEAERVARAGGAIDTLVFVEEGPYFLRKPTLTPLRGDRLVTAYVELIDANGYWVEKAGLFSLGSPSAQALRIGEACVQAMNEVKRMIRPGMRVGELGGLIRRCGDSVQAVTGIWHGHGIGVDHDIPVISDDGDEILEPGMVVSIHPNFADADEQVGASIADVFIVGDEDARGLSKLPYDIVKV
ncbi:M24 family metallopeptidase [Paenibacillus sp. 1P07SE]|uniref:M24 family metallopeptidase n=1 Tax=Paenibacillus sp. 1P07SE TaxID=3132209 RepID=UPI0039A75DF5